MCLFCSLIFKGICWRDDRSWMLVDEVSFNVEFFFVIVIGVVRGCGFKVDRFV